MEDSDIQENILPLRRPVFWRWIVAFFLASLAAPFFAPFSWAFIITEGIGPDSFLFVMFWTYLFGFPVALCGVLVYLILVFFFYSWFAQKPALHWSIMGALCAIFIIGGVYLILDFERIGNWQDYLFALSGPIPGFFAGYVAHYCLLKKAQ